ncbi:autotransporter outer membrane beta-barrel domain-containing protein [Flavobacterium hauense]
MSNLTKLQAYLEKVDTPERLAMFEGIGEEYYADAEFLNLIRASLIELYLGPAGLDQNNIGRVISTGYLIPISGTTTKENVVARLNAMALVITEKQTPVIVTIIQLSETFTAQRYKYLFKPGKGMWGIGGTLVEASHLELLVGENVQMGDAGIDANTVTISLGALPNHTFLPTLNSQERNFSAEHSEYQVSYSVSGKTYILFFTGAKGIYGGSGTQFTATQFSKLTNSDVAPYITYTSQLINNGDGVSPYATKAFVNGLEIEVNPATAEMYLKNYDGITLATINLAFLNNEGTTFVFNSATMSLELQNDAGEVLTSVPASAFVSNLIQQVDFKASVPELLEFKGPSGTLIDSVTFTIANIQGLQGALDGKVNTNGANATGNWPINISGVAAQANLWGSSYADFTVDGSGITHAVVYDDVASKARRYTASSFKLWLAIGMSEVSGLISALAGKANTNGTNATGNWPISITGNAVTANDAANWSPVDVIDFNTPQGGKFTLIRALQNAANRPGIGLYGTGIRLNTAGNAGFNTDLISDVTGRLYTRYQAGADWNAWEEIATTGYVAAAITSKADNTTVLHKAGAESITGTKTFDVSPVVPDGVTGYHAVNVQQLQIKANNSDVIHTYSDETKNGSLTLQGNNKGYYLGVAGQNASILYNSDGNLDITPRAGYSTVFKGGNVIVTNYGNTGISVRSQAGGGFPLIQLLDNARTGGSDWNIENGRSVAGDLGFYSSSNSQVITFKQNGAASFAGTVTMANATSSSHGATLGQLKSHSEATGNVHSMVIADIPNLSDKLSNLSGGLDTLAGKVLSDIKNLDFPEPGAHTTAKLSVLITFTGAAVGDEVTIIPPLSILTNALTEKLIFKGFVSAANEITALVTNPSATAITSLNPADFKIVVRKV